MFKKINVLLAIFVIFVFFTSFAYATDIEAAGTTAEALHTDDLNVNTIYSNNDLGVGSFTDLQNIIDNTNNSVIILNKNYTYSSIDSNLIKGIVIKNKNITIEGNGYTLNGLNTARIFSTTSSNITLKNLNFINGKYNSDGGAISASRGYLKIDNCNFTNNEASSGGAISTTSKVDIYNSLFKNNKVNSYSFGGAIDFYGDYIVNIINSSFLSNVGYRGGAIYNANSNLNCINTKFWYNKASYLAGAVHDHEGQSNFLNCSFLDNYGRFGGAIAAYSGINVNVVNSSFIKNSAYFGGAISSENININGSTFVGNKANVGGAIYIVNGSIDDSIFTANSADIGKDICSLYNLSITNSEIALSDIVLYNATYTSIKHDFFFITENGYEGYCAIPFATPPTYGYFVDNLDFIQNYVLNTYVGEYLKILIYTNFEDLGSLINAIEIFTMGDYLHSNDEKVKAVLEKYNSGFRVPDKNATLILKNGTVASIDFTTTATINKQNLILFNVSYGGYLNLSALKISLNKTVIVGNQTSFMIVVSNTGNRALFGISVLENIPEGLIFDSFTGNNWIKNENNFLYNGTLNAGESCNFTITCNTTITGNFTNVIVIKSNLTNETTVNNTTEVLSPSLSVVKIANDPVVYLANQTSFTVVVRNTGDCALGGVWVVDNIPDGLVYASFTGVNWIKVGNKFIYNSTLAIGKSANFTITFNTTKSGNFTNVVVAGANNTGNKTANNTTEVIDKSVTPGNDTDNKTHIPDSGVIPSIENQSKNVSKSISMANATGNPILALLMLLALIGLRPLRGKK